MIRSTQSHLAAISRGLRSGAWIEPQTAGEIVSFLSFHTVYLFFYKTNLKNIYFFLIIFDPNYCHANQTAVFYIKKIHLKYLSLIYSCFYSSRGSFDQNKYESWHDKWISFPLLLNLPTHCPSALLDRRFLEKSTTMGNCSLDQPLSTLKKIGTM